VQACQVAAGPAHAGCALERLIGRAVAPTGSEVIELDDVPRGGRAHYATALMPSLAGGETLRTWGSRYARLVLERAPGTKREACRVRW
jgi:hypothetical protein